MFNASSGFDVAQYDQLEAAAMETMPNRIIQCALPVTFGSLGYPIRVEKNRSLVRFVDVMHETRSFGTFHDHLRGVTEHEFGLLRQVTRATRENSLKRYGSARIATSSLLRALVMYRSLTALYPEKGRLIFEIGHGSGYLGALLVADGYAYASTDVTQGFYVHQNHLLNTLIPGKVTELATGGDFPSVSEVKPGHALHVPWWKFYSASPKTDLTVDAVTCNHTLAEMHLNARSYAIKFARMMLRNPDSAFVFEGWGTTIHTPIWAVTKRFCDLGYVVAHNDLSGSVFVPNDGGATEGTLELPLPHKVGPLGNPNGFPESEYIRQYHPPIYVNPDSPLSKRFTDGLATAHQNVKIGYEPLMAMFQEELGESDLISDDERFTEFVFSS